MGGGAGLHSPVYHLLSADLRMPPANSLAPIIQTGEADKQPLLDPSLPTLLLFECVLVYMTPTQSSALIQWFVDYFARTGNSTALGGIVYEMFGLSDPFGKVMLSNLRVRLPSMSRSEFLELISGKTPEQACGIAGRRTVPNIHFFAKSVHATRLSAFKCYHFT